MFTRGMCGLRQMTHARFFGERNEHRFRRSNGLGVGSQVVGRIGDRNTQNGFQRENERYPMKNSTRTKIMRENGRPVARYSVSKVIRAVLK